MYRLQSDYREQAEALARLWGNYFQDEYERGFNDGMRYWSRFSSASCLSNPIDGLPSFLASEPCTSNTDSGTYFCFPEPRNAVSRKPADPARIKFQQESGLERGAERRSEDGFPTRNSIPGNG